MKIYIVALTLMLLACNTYSNSECSELNEHKPGSQTETSFWGSLFGETAPEANSNCDSKTETESQSKVSVGPKDSFRSEREIKALITAGRESLELTLEEYKRATGEEISDLNHVVSTLKKELGEHKEKSKQSTKTTAKELSDLSDSQSKLNDFIETNNNDYRLSIDKISKELSEVSANLIRAENTLDEKVEDNRQAASESLADLGRLISNNINYLLISILSLLLIFSLLFFYLRKKMSVQSIDLTGSLLETRKSLEEEFVKIDNKLVDIFEVQMQAETNAPVKVDAEVDHSLVIKIADEVVRIQKNITRMDEKTKGLKQLAASVIRIKDNVASNGYEIVDMLGKPYSKGLKGSVDFIVDDDLAVGDQIITRVIKPQINYQGVMIQSAQIEVSQGE